ncbi:unnamed protein product [Arctia plantaginis]|uniref:Uncharacterized protein n=1 Tax=Arctia plantaginis TaxID=874455 RepID=A0A8S1BNS5_ARCPL|nr:unnamed protein product [Arctia plantaginis]CAB3262043.1 unnamed protein product [Arctia plantaginis]
MAEPDISIKIPIGGDGEGMGFGAAISEKLASTISNMDVVSTLQKMISTIPEDEESEDIRNRLKNAIEQFQLMSDEEKAEFTLKVKEGLMSKLQAKLEESGALNQLEDAIRGAVMSKLYMIAAGFILLVILLVFFGYKLYKSIKDKEKKKEEKKKAKQSKKKK